jgi:hypothetical protein
MNGAETLYESDDEAIEAWESDDESVLQQGEFLQALLPALAGAIPSVISGIGGLFGGGGGGSAPRPPLPQVRLPQPGSGVQSAQLTTPAGQATIRLPAEVPTKDDLRQMREALQAAINAENSRINAIQKDLQTLTQRIAVVVADQSRDMGRIRTTLARQRREQAAALARLKREIRDNQMMGMMFPIIFQQQIQTALDSHTHTLPHDHPVTAGQANTGDASEETTTAPAAAAGGSGFNPMLLALPMMMGSGQDGQSGDQSYMMPMMMMMAFR